MCSGQFSLVSETASVDARFDGGIGRNICLLPTAGLIAVEVGGFNCGAAG